jgi:polyphosphate kinase 2 (PPK2 family)
MKTGKDNIIQKVMNEQDTTVKDVSGINTPSDPFHHHDYHAS